MRWFIYITLQVFGFMATFLIAISIWTSYKVTCGSQPTGESDPGVQPYNYTKEFTPTLMKIDI